MRVGNVGKLVIAIVLCELAGVVGSVFTYPSIPTWYASLQKPSFNPPNWLFAPVWLILFALMGVSAYLVWSKGLESEGVKAALFIFVVQLVLNVLWSIVFFGLHSIFYSFVIIIVLWIAIALTITAFVRVSKKAGALLLPYILWVSFASVLNYYIWLLNP
ncbi:MAG: tryptophan-rich sensory protein [archaeon]|nr:tryptophan-rich sensory protein [archaeon]MCP8306391.1 tryptophan-rich sensory protein [archaeon]